MCFEVFQQYGTPYERAFSPIRPTLSGKGFWSLNVSSATRRIATMFQNPHFVKTHVMLEKCRIMAKQGSNMSNMPKMSLKGQNSVNLNGNNHSSVLQKYFSGRSVAGNGLSLLCVNRTLRSHNMGCTRLNLLMLNE
jgi:hypothetical protein